VEDFIIIKDKKIPTILAITAEEQEKGLMHCNDLPPSMSFVYSKSNINKFWMKNTPKPLDIIFCNEDKILHIAHGEPFSLQAVGPNEPTNLVIEMPYGTCLEHGFRVGDTVKKAFSIISTAKIINHIKIFK